MKRDRVGSVTSARGGTVRRVLQPATAFVVAAGMALIAGACAGGPPPEIASYSEETALHALVDGVRIHYFDHNPDAPGTPILWIHGYSGTGFETTFIRDHFDDARRIVAPDLPGSGLSEKPELDYTLDFFVSMMTGFASAVGLSQYILVGHSMGGMIAASMAADQSQPVERLVLISPYGLPGQAGAFVEFLSTTGPLVDVGMQLYPERLLGILLRTNVFYDPALIPSDLVDYYTLSMFHTGHAREALANVTRNTIADSLEPGVLESIRIPTLIVWGDHDRVLSPSFADSFRAAIPASRLAVIEKSGHVPHVERPEETGRVISDFLSD